MNKQNKQLPGHGKLESGGWFGKYHPPAPSQKCNEMHVCKCLTLTKVLSTTTISHGRKVQAILQMRFKDYFKAGGCFEFLGRGVAYPSNKYLGLVQSPASGGKVQPGPTHHVELGIFKPGNRAGKKTGCRYFLVPLPEAVSRRRDGGGVRSLSGKSQVPVGPSGLSQAGRLMSQGVGQNI